MAGPRLRHSSLRSVVTLTRLACDRAGTPPFVAARARGSLRAQRRPRDSQRRRPSGFGERIELGPGRSGPTAGSRVVQKYRSAWAKRAAGASIRPPPIGRTRLRRGRPDDRIGHWLALQRTTPLANRGDCPSAGVSRAMGALFGLTTSTRRFPRLTPLTRSAWPLECELNEPTTDKYASHSKAEADT
jgi:hypothetical protein